MSEKKDWTASRGRSNSSRKFQECVEAVLDILHAHRLGTLPATTARLIVARLAHEQGLAPADVHRSTRQDGEERE